MRFFNRDQPLWRLSVPRLHHHLRLQGDWLIDWGGAQRWLFSDESAVRIRQLASDIGGHAMLFRHDNDSDDIFHPLTDGLLALHQRLKAALDPQAIFNPGRMYKQRLSMKTELTQAHLDSPEGQRADSILRSCVHCGFCNATCPTYQLLGDELDGPRGRIYQIKQVLEGQPATRSLQTHLDRCLTCRACETTCPSGVDYHSLLDTGRELVEQQVPRPLAQRLLRRTLVAVLSHATRANFLFSAARLFRPYYQRT